MKLNAAGLAFPLYCINVYIKGMCATRSSRTLIGCGADTQCALIGGERGCRRGTDVSMDGGS